MSKHPMQVIITRPEADAIRTARQVADLGFAPVIAPLAQVRLRQTAIPAGSFDGIIITSRHALEGAVASSLSPHLATPVSCVGKATAEGVKQTGFQSIRHHAATVDALIASMLDHLAPHQSWLYLAGDPRKNVIEHALSGKVQLEICMTYHIEDMDHFPQAALDMLTDPHPVWLHYSDKSAERAAKLLARSRKANLFSQARHLVLSASIAQTVQNLGGTDISMAQEPDQPAMLEALLTMQQEKAGY